jgi:hypothetical protein
MIERLLQLKRPKKEMSNNVQQLIQKYQDEVDAIPECRPLMELNCEVAVKVLKELEEKYSPEMDQKELIRSVLISCGGFLSPVMANSLIEEWKQAKKEKQ